MDPNTFAVTIDGDLITPRPWPNCPWPNAISCSDDRAARPAAGRFAAAQRRPRPFRRRRDGRRNRADVHSGRSGAVPARAAAHRRARDCVVQRGRRACSPTTGPGGTARCPPAPLRPRCAPRPGRRARRYCARSPACGRCQAALVALRRPHQPAGARRGDPRGRGRRRTTPPRLPCTTCSAAPARRPCACSASTRSRSRRSRPNWTPRSGRRTPSPRRRSRSPRTTRLPVRRERAHDRTARRRARPPGGDPLCIVRKPGPDPAGRPRSRALRIGIGGPGRRRQDRTGRGPVPGAGRRTVGRRGDQRHLHHRGRGLPAPQRRAGRRADPRRAHRLLPAHRDPRRHHRQPRRGRGTRARCTTPISCWWKAAATT